MTDSIKQSPVTWLVSLGLGAVLAYNGADWLMKSSDGDKAFIQTKLIAAIESQTASAVASAAALTATTTQLTQLSDQIHQQRESIDDVAEANTKLAVSIEKLLEREHETRRNRPSEAATP